MHPAEKNEPQGISGLIFCYIFPEEEARNIQTIFFFFFTHRSFIYLDTTVQNQNSISPLFMDTTALILAYHPSLKEVSTTRRKILDNWHMWEWIQNTRVATTQTQSFQGARTGFKGHFLNHDMFSSFVE